MNLLKEGPRRWLTPVTFAVLTSCVAASLTASWNAKQYARDNHVRLVALAVKAYHAAADAKALAEFGDRIIDLPEDGAGWHTTVFTSDDMTPHERRIIGWFSSDPQLKRLAAQTHFHHYTPKSSVYARYQNVTASGLPAIMLQDETGKVIYKTSGANVPQAEWPLVKGIIESIRAHCPHCPRPKPSPAPAPAPAPPMPDVAPGPPHIVPDVVGPNDATPPDAKDDTVPVALAVFFLALVAAFAAQSRKDAVNSLA